MEELKEYRNYQINCVCAYNTRLTETWVCLYRVYKNNENIFSFKFSGTEQWLFGFPYREGLSKLKDEGFNLAYGLIDIEKYKEFKKGEVQEFDASEWQVPTGKSKIRHEDIQHEILKALNEICIENSKTFKTAQFNKIGFCKILQITENHLEYNINYLEGKGLIEKDKDYIYITPNGIDWLEQGRYKDRIIDPITSEIQKLVHERLNEINPDIFNRLERIKKQLIEEGKDFKWQQVAFECRDIIQDFTHSLYRPKYLPKGEKAPKKSETKKKLRFILQNRLNNSEKTERELLEGLIEYLYKYFDCLNELIQKGVHEDIEKSDAERCLIYTYLFIGDVLSLTKL